MHLFLNFMNSKLVLWLGRIWEQTLLKLEVSDAAYLGMLQSHQAPRVSGFQMCLSRIIVL